MTEHLRPEPDRYWNVDEAIGEAHFWGEAWTVRLAAHVAEEPYRRGLSDLVPLRAARGTRTYVQARPYILVPDFRLTAELSPTTGAGAIGQVRDSEWRGMKGERIGRGQAWFYHEDRVLVLWECFLEDRYQTGEAPDDPNLHVVWEGFERFLGARFPTARQLVTTADDPLYETAAYQRFLQMRGYERLNARACGKTVRAT